MVAKTMRAVVVESGELSVCERAVPQPQAGEALVRVSMAGLCSTDRELARGYLGFSGVPGHEFVGMVEHAQQAQDLVGKRVVGEINAACGNCEQCQDGLERHCVDRSVLGIVGRCGAFAEYLTLPIANLHVIPETLSDDRAVFVEPLAAAYEILAQVAVVGFDVAVVGVGKLGGLCAQVLHHAGARVTLIGRDTESLEGYATQGRTVSTWAEPKAAGTRFDVVVECSGREQGFAQALSLARPRGTLVLKTTCSQPHTVDLSPIVINELSVVGSRCGAFGPAIDALIEGDFEPEKTICARFALADAKAAFAAAFDPTSSHAAFPGGKVVFDMRPA